MIGFNDGGFDDDDDDDDRDRPHVGDGLFR